MTWQRIAGGQRQHLATLAAVAPLPSPVLILDLNVKVIASLGVPFKNFVNRFVCLLLLFYGAKYYT